jgi:hypothetical protein
VAEAVKNASSQTSGRPYINPRRCDSSAIV